MMRLDNPQRLGVDMVSNFSTLSVVDGQTGEAQPEFTVHAADAARWLPYLNALVQVSGATRTLSLGRPADRPSISVSRANAGLPAGLRLSRIRGLRGVCRSLSASLELVVVTRASGDGVPTGRFVRNLQARFGIANVSQIVSPGCMQVADVDGGDTSQQSWVARTFGKFVESIASIPDRKELVIVSGDDYDAFCDMAVGLTNARQHAVQISTDASELEISACYGATENAAVLPQLFTALWFNGDRAAAATLERAWLSCLEEGVVPEGFESIKPYSRVLPRREFFEVVSSRIGRNPRQLRASLPMDDSARPALTLVAS